MRRAVVNEPHHTHAWKYTPRRTQDREASTGATAVLARAVDATRDCDLFLAVGTSLWQDTMPAYGDRLAAYSTRLEKREPAADPGPHNDAVRSFEEPRPRRG